MIKKIPVITIDGPSGAGKTTTSKIISKKLNWKILESGKIYRLVAHLVLKEKIIVNEKNILALINQINFCILRKKNYFYDAINTEKISELSSIIASLPKIRDILLKEQRLFLHPPGLIAEGRDMGTVVFPDAIIKFFLYSSLESRVKRRLLELKQNSEKIDFKDLLNKIKKRDQRDKNRSISPLRIPKNAIIIDSTHMNIFTVIKILMNHIIKIIKV